MDLRYSTYSKNHPKNEIHNILYFDEAVLKLAGEKARDEIKYLHKMYDLIKQRRLAIEAATEKWHMDHDTLLAICHTINNFGDEPQKMAAKHAILNMDFSKIADVNAFAAELQNHSNTRNIGRGIRTTRNNNNRTPNPNTPNASLNNIRSKNPNARHAVNDTTYLTAQIPRNWKNLSKQTRDLLEVHKSPNMPTRR